ncbi:MAG: hypothetical protein AAF721_08910 [Myxococcota bacterium]
MPRKPIRVTLDERRLQALCRSFGNAWLDHVVLDPEPGAEHREDCLERAVAWNVSQWLEFPYTLAASEVALPHEEWAAASHDFTSILSDLTNRLRHFIYAEDYARSDAGHDFPDGESPSERYPMDWDAARAAVRAAVAEGLTEKTEPF